jgi:hypothetical protein
LDRTKNKKRKACLAFLFFLRADFLCHMEIRLRRTSAANTTVRGQRAQPANFLLKNRFLRAIMWSDKQKAAARQLFKYAAVSLN